MPARRRHQAIERLITTAVDGVLPAEGENPAAVAITFPGGDYVVPTGGMAEDAVAVRHLLTAYFLHREPPPEELRTHALRLAFAILRLADHVSGAAQMDRLGRVAAPDARPALARALRLSSSELAHIVGDHRSVLDPLITDDAGRSAWNVTPILKDGDTHILVGADELLVVLRYWLVVLAEQHGWREVLAERLAAAYASTVRRSL